MEENTTNSKNIFYILMFFVIILAGFILKSLSSVILPVIFAVMLAFVLFPIIKKINNKTRIPWIVSTLLVFFLFLIVFIGISSLIINSLTTIFDQYPKYEKKFMSIYTILAENFNLEIDSTKSLEKLKGKRIYSKSCSFTFFWSGFFCKKSFDNCITFGFSCS